MVLVSLKLVVSTFVLINRTVSWERLSWEPEMIGGGDRSLYVIGNNDV
jgi:hypothetical protein